LGELPSSSQYPFEDYLGSLGEAETPMLVAYEAQYLDVEMNRPDQIRNHHMVMMYLSTSADAVHTAVPFSTVGNAIGQLLNGSRDDTDIMRLEAEHGFRTYDPDDTFDTVMQERGITVQRDGLSNLAPLPRFDYFEELINGI